MRATCGSTSSARATGPQVDPREPGRLFVLGRILLGICFLLDAGWIVGSYDVRVAYMDAVGASHSFLWLNALAYAVCGMALVVGYRVRLAAIPLASVLLLMSIVLLTDLDTTGIGEYPPELHYEVIFKEWVVHLAIIGALVAMAGEGAGSGAGPLETPIESWSRAGRVVLGLYFVVNGLWQWYYFDIRVEHIVATGGNPGVLPVVIGIQLLGGSLIAAGLAMWVAAVPLIAIVVLSTIRVHGDLSEAAPYPPNVQVHQWFVKAALVAGLMMILGHPRNG